MKSIGMNFIKYILFIFNLVFAISGLGVLIAGAVFLAEVVEFDHFIEGRVLTPSIVLIIVGLLVFFIASLGCYGAIKESPSLLMTFAVLLGIIFIIELACGIAACVYKADLEMSLEKSLMSTIKRSNSEDLIAWDNVQKKLMCCGLKGTSDWVDYSRNGTLRSSCCVPLYIEAESKDCRLSGALYKDKYYQEGCLTKLTEKIGSNASIIIGVGIGIAFIQLIGIILACWLASTIRRELLK